MKSSFGKNINLMRDLKELVKLHDWLFVKKKGEKVHGKYSVYRLETLSVYVDPKEQEIFFDEKGKWLKIELDDLVDKLVA